MSASSDNYDKWAKKLFRIIGGTEWCVVLHCNKVVRRIMGDFYSAHTVADIIWFLHSYVANGAEQCNGLFIFC